MFAFIFRLELKFKSLSNNILLISTETYSSFTDYNDKNSVFFGDGAAAVILMTREEAEKNSIKPYQGSTKCRIDQTKGTRSQN